MKKTLALLLVLVMSMGISGLHASAGEPSTLNLNWKQAGGTDTQFECPWVDIQCLLSYMIFDTLIKLEPDGTTVVPALAQSLDISDDGLTYAFTLVEGVKWHDGAPFSAEDVLFSFNVSAIEPSSYITPRLAPVQGVQDYLDGKADAISGITADGNKVTVTLDTPDNSLIADVFTQFCILPKHLLENVDPTLLSRDEAYWKKPVGTGVYKLDQVSFPNYCTAIRNDDYFGPKAKIDTVTFTSYEVGGIEAYTAALIAGNLDFAYGNDINDIARAQNIVAQNPDVKMLIVPSTYQRQFWFNNTESADGKYNPDMQKKEVRQAFDLLIDKETVASFYAGQAVSLSTFVNPDFPAYNTSIPLFQRDVEKGKQMLEEAGFDFNRPVRLLYYYDDSTTADIMELLKQNFAEAGVKLEPFLAAGDLASQIYELKNYDFMYVGYGGSDPVLVYTLYIPDGGIMDGLFGDVEFRAETLGSLLSDYKSVVDTVEKKKIGDQIQLEAGQYALALAVYGMNQIIVYNTASLRFDESIYNTDLLGVNRKFYDWELVK